MKSEHRHELAENNLAKLLGKLGAEFDKHANTILTVLIVLTLLAGGFIWWTRSTSATNALGWAELTAARSAEDFAGVAETFPGTRVAQWATLRAADGFLDEGIRLSLTDRPVSNERLQQAKDSYESVLEDPSVPPEIREQALMGYAITLESSSDGDTTGAIAAYEALLEEFERTRFRAFTEDRIKALKTGGVQDFYAWFHQLNPQPAPRPEPQDQIGSIDPDSVGNLLNLGDGSIPETPPLELPELLELPTGSTLEDKPNPFASEEAKDAGVEETTDSPANEPPADTAEKPDADATEPAEQPGSPQQNAPETEPESSTTSDDSSLSESP